MEGVLEVLDFVFFEPFPYGHVRNLSA